MSTININSEDGTVKYLTGNAETFERSKLPKGFTHATTISGPADFIKHRSPDIETTHITYSYSGFYIRALINENLPEENQVKIRGKIELSQILVDLKINNGCFSVDELHKLIRFNKNIFVSQDVCATLISALKHFTKNVSTQSEILKDIQQGRHVMAVERVVESSLSNVETFQISIPIFKGEDPNTIAVTIFVDPSDTGATKIYLESEELNEFIEAESERIIDQELQRLEQYICLQTI